MQNPVTSYNNTIGKLPLFPRVLCWVLLVLELLGIWHVICWVFNI